MSDPSKPASTFSFGQPQSTATSGSLFGSSSQPPSGGGLFGNTATNSAPGTSLFGSSTAPGQPSPFGGGGSGGSSVFGNAGKPASGGFSFTSNAPPGTGLFGAAPATSTSTAAPSAGFAGFATPNKPSDASTGQAQKSSMFGGANTGNTGLFNLGSNAPAASQPSLTTPTSKPALSMFGNSTTPAGPPPTTTAASGPTFSFAKPQGQPNTTTSSAPSIFGNAFQADTSSATGGSTTTATTSQAAPSIFESASKGDSFSGGLKSPDKDAKKAANPFGQTPSTTSAAPPTGPSTFAGASTASPFNLGKPSAPAASSGPTNTSLKPVNSGFSFPIQPTASSGTSSPATTAPSAPTTGFFSNLGKPQGNTTTTSAPTTSSSTNQTPSLFPNLGKSPTPAAGTTQAPAADTSKAAPTPASKDHVAGAATNNLGASTAGPAPPAQSRLKNKSMDDIITRWASDLSKYQKEFQDQANKVAHWDRLIIENSEKIQRLYGSTLEAERATSEVERQLTSVENDQAELEMWLERYEKEVDEMIASQVGQGEGVSGPDQERERTYQLACRLSERLDEMGRDLTSMIEEINDASSSLGKNTNPDDPLTHVVRTLNTHLTQLQQIDQGASALTLKVQEAQKASRSMIAPGGGAGGFGGGGVGGSTGEAADAFWKSYLGRR